MNFCPYCGNELDGNFAFCPACGKAVTEPSAAEDSPVAPPQQIPPPASKKRITPKAGIAAAMLCILIFIVIAATKPFSVNFSEDTDAIAKAASSVAELYCYDANNLLNSTGSAFAALEDDILITNYHVIEGNVYSIEVLTEDGAIYAVDSVVAYDKEKDIAVLRVPDCPLQQLKIGETVELEKGQQVVAIGNPQGYTNTVSTGLFSNLWDLETHIMIQFSAPISPGSSGGALFNDRGEVIGITTASRTDAEDIYLAVPIEYAQELYDTSSPETELTVTQLYEQSSHPYTVNYILACGDLLHNQSVLVQGYISAIDGSSIYLVSAPEHVLFIDTRSVFDLATSLALRELRSDGFALQTDLARNKLSANDLSCGDFISIEGTVSYYSANDIRFTADKLYQ